MLVFLHMLRYRLAVQKPGVTTQQGLIVLIRHGSYEWLLSWRGLRWIDDGSEQMAPCSADDVGTCRDVASSYGVVLVT